MMLSQLSLSPQPNLVIKLTRGLHALRDKPEELACICSAICTAGLTLEGSSA